MIEKRREGKLFGFCLHQNTYVFVLPCGSFCFTPCSGFSYVDLVEGLHDGRFYALKRIICHDKDDHKEALHEVEMHLLFEHPNILPICAHAMVEKGSKHEAWLLLPFLKVSSLQTNFLSKR